MFDWKRVDRLKVLIERSVPAFVRCEDVRKNAKRTAVRSKSGHTIEEHHMTRRGYRGGSTLEERLSNEFQRIRTQARGRQPVAPPPVINEEPTDGLEERRKRMHEMAGDAIDGVSDVSASLEDQASRKRSLLEGPDEFQIVRVDRAKTNPR
jgi:hypothetical protein